MLTLNRTAKVKATIYRRDVVALSPHAQRVRKDAGGLDGQWPLQARPIVGPNFLRHRRAYGAGCGG